MPISKRDVLSLYRKILRKGNESLQYTNKEYFRRRIREEFEMADQMIGDSKKRQTIREKMYRKGMEFLNSNIGGII